MKYRIEVAGENALIIYFGDGHTTIVSVAIADQIQLVSLSLHQHLGSLLLDIIPSYASIMLVFDAYKTDQYAVRKLIQQTCSNSSTLNRDNTKVVELPVYYGESVGLDLAAMSASTGLSAAEIVELHQSVEYRVFAIGFAPGFAYLGNVDERIATPRLATPRKMVPKGAVGIADRQTAVYPTQSPGGWNIIGRCPIDMFEPNREPAMHVDVGSIVRFKAVNKDIYLQLGGTLD